MPVGGCLIIVLESSSGARKIRRRPCTLQDFFAPPSVVNDRPLPPPYGAVSDFIVFADESGDHGLDGIDPQFPVFSMLFCLFHKTDYFRKTDYCDVIEPAVRRFKFEHFGHDAIVLHEHESRKEKAAFAVLRTNPGLRAAFLSGLSSLIDGASISVYASVIDKLRLKERYANPYNPYEISLRFLMERLAIVLCVRASKVVGCTCCSRAAAQARTKILSWNSAE